MAANSQKELTRQQVLSAFSIVSAIAFSLVQNERPAIGRWPDKATD